LPLYKGLRVHGYWTVDETKMSKSLGNVIKPLELKDKYGLAPFRYFLLREMHFGLDANFSEEAFVNRLNSDLANDLGNLFSRVLTMTNKYFAGKVPSAGKLEAEDEAVIGIGLESIANFQNLFARFQFARALESLWEFVRYLNKYIDQTAPWQLAKEKQEERLATVIYLLLEGLRKIALHLWPVMPSVSVEMLKQLGVDFEVQKVDLLAESKEWGKLEAGLKVAKKSNLFPRQEIKLEQNKEAASSASLKEKKEYVSFEDFKKLDLRVGKILSATRVEKSDKLLKLEVDLGEDKPRQIIAGIAPYFSPAELMGKEVIVVSNLKPRKIFGQLSEGMVLAANDGQSFALLTVSKEVKEGTKIS
ncbi:MAG: Methionine--tRNA ligase, partial [Desulfonauticus sp. 38_4375]